MFLHSLPTAAATAASALGGKAAVRPAPLLLMSIVAGLYLLLVPMGGVVFPAIDHNVVLFFLLIIPAMGITDGLCGIPRNGSLRGLFSPGNPVILLFSTTDSMAA